MKRSLHLLCVFLLIPSFFIAQEYNAFDAQGERHGSWKKYYDDSKQLRYEGTFDHGKEVGVFKFYDKGSGTQPSATKAYTAGSTILDVAFYQPDGKKVCEGQMDGRKRIGTWTYYHKNGTTVMTTEAYSKGILEGERLVYYENGAVAERVHYISGKEQGESQHYTEKKTLLSSYTYEAGKRHGPARIYDVDGNLIREGKYKEGMKHGLWKYYKGGKLDKEIRFPVNRIGVQD